MLREFTQEPLITSRAGITQCYNITMCDGNINHLFQAKLLAE